MPVLQDMDNLNEDISIWEKNNKRDLVAELNALGVKHYRRSPNKISLQKALKSKLRKRLGLIDRISYLMPQSAIFLAKGVSKGHPISNPREAKDWYNPVLDGNLNGLGEIVADGGGNLIINNINIK